MYGCVKYLFILLSCMGICFPSSAQDSPIEVTAAYPVASQKYQSITLSGALRAQGYDRHWHRKAGGAQSDRVLLRPHPLNTRWYC